MSTYEEIISAALSLPPGSRAMLAEHLLDSLNGEEQKRIDALWADEIERRIKEVDEGKVIPIPGDEVMERLRSRREDVQSDREFMLKDLLMGVTKKNRHPEVDFGYPVGKEKL